MGRHRHRGHRPSQPNCLICSLAGNGSYDERKADFCAEPDFTKRVVHAQLMRGGRRGIGTYTPADTRRLRPAS